MVRRWLVLIAVSVFLTACGTETITDHASSATGKPHSSSPTDKPNAAAPATFVAVLEPEENQKLSLLSSKTGAVLRVLTSTGPNFTNNGLTRSPDGRWIYATWIGKHSLRIERIPSTGGPRTFIANGSQPAISPDGRYLAYITGKRDHFVAVRDLHTDRARMWNLLPLIGSKLSLFNGQVLWSGSGELVVLPGEVGERVGGAANKATNSGKCPQATCLIHFDPREAHPNPKVERFDPGDGWLDFYSAGTSVPDSMIVSRMLGEKTEFDLVDISTGRPSHLITFTGMPLALDRSGTHLLYLVGHSPPALWSAEIHDGKLTHRHRILKSAQIFGGVVW